MLEPNFLIPLDTAKLPLQTHPNVLLREEGQLGGY